MGFSDHHYWGGAVPGVIAGLGGGPGGGGGGPGVNAGPGGGGGSGGDGSPGGGGVPGVNAGPDEGGSPGRSGSGEKDDHSSNAGPRGAVGKQVVVRNKTVRQFSLTYRQCLRCHSHLITVSSFGADSF